MLRHPEDRHEGGTSDDGRVLVAGHHRLKQTGGNVMLNDLTGLIGMSQEEFQHLVRGEYTRLRAAWFPAVKPSWLPGQVWQDSQQPADLLLVWDDSTANCGYVFKDNRLIIAAEEGWLQLGKDTEEGEEPTAVY